MFYLVFMSPEGWGKFEVIKLLKGENLKIPKKKKNDVTNGPNSTLVKKMLIFFLMTRVNVLGLPDNWFFYWLIGQY